MVTDMARSSSCRACNDVSCHLLQGPVADALTHVGQLATLRRIGGSPVRGEYYSRASITIGRVGADQPPPAFEFD